MKFTHPMNSLTPPSNLRLLVAGFIILCAGRLAAANVTGTFESVGAAVQETDGRRATVSLRGLVGLEFDHELARLTHGEVSRVSLDQKEGAFRIRCHRDDGSLEWEGYWERQKGYGLTPEEQRPKILFRSPRLGDDSVALTFWLEADGRMLAVSAERLVASTFGPIIRPLGTFLFARTEAP